MLFLAVGGAVMTSSCETIEHVKRGRAVCVARLNDLFRGIVVPTSFIVARARAVYYVSANGVVSLLEA